MPVTKSLLNTPPDATPDTTITVNGSATPARVGERLIDALNRYAVASDRKPVPQVCYLPQMGPIQSCDTCMVAVPG
jgi:formate dehydrogenase major subunit